ncbi:MAG: hypothetical protein QOF60_3221 [Actinomycetota bacterium]|jgi:DNA-directed RNA polymerase specialized sigma24 family protein|nr:hypothetical protein [Actinomycetota bacterium]
MGILALLVANREDATAEAKDRQKTEVILAAAGLSASTIAQMMNKNVDAVRKTLQRAR